MPFGTHAGAAVFVRTRTVFLRSLYTLSVVMGGKQSKSATPGGARRGGSGRVPWTNGLEASFLAAPFSQFGQVAFDVGMAEKFVTRTFVVDTFEAYRDMIEYIGNDPKKLKFDWYTKTGNEYRFVKHEDASPDAFLEGLQASPGSAAMTFETDDIDANEWKQMYEFLKGMAEENLERDEKETFDASATETKPASSLFPKNTARNLFLLSLLFVLACFVISACQQFD